MLTKITGRGGISAKIIAHSIDDLYQREVITFELEYPRFVHCFDEETEVLSQVADECPKFRTFPAVEALQCKVAQYIPESEEVEFVYPEDFITDEGLHDMVGFDKNKLSMHVTDGHRVFTNKRTTNNEFKENVILAKDLLSSYGTLRIPQSGFMKNNQQTYSDDELSLIAWYVADGHKENKNTSNFHFTKPRKVVRVSELLSSLGIDFEVHKYENEFVIRFNNPHWVEECYSELGEKVLPNKACFMGDSGYASFKQALLQSDGCEDNMEYNTSSKQLMEQIQVIAHLHGDAMNMKCYSGLYKQKFMKSNYISLRQDKDEFKKYTTHNTVYCVSVPSSFVMVRRKGVVYVSGNCELMTHRMFSRNAASSRAIPIEKMMDQVENNPAKPIYWGLNQSGMQAEGEHPNPDECRNDWEWAAQRAVSSANDLKDLGLHKQIVNRILEPFQMMKTIVTATEFANFFHLRRHKDAQPEIKHLADLMYECFINSEPQILLEGEWHLPYVYNTRDCMGELLYLPRPLEDIMFDDEGGIDKTKVLPTLTLEEAQKVSASCCAQVSYRTLDDSLEKALRVYDRLANSDIIHGSVFEHQATPIVCDNRLHGLRTIPGVTHMDCKKELWSGNFRGWIQYRQLFDDHTNWNYIGEET